VLQKLIFIGAIKIMRSQRLSLLMVCLLFFLPLSAAGQAEFWPGVTVTGTMKNHHEIKYWLNTQERFSIPPDSFLQAILEAGLGYQSNPFMSSWLGYTFSSTRDAQITGVDRTSRLWQRIIYDAVNSNQFALTLTTRLEEGTRHGTSGIGIRFRQKFYFAFPGESKKITPEISEEIFLNITHPAWINDNNTVDQNRLFIGVRINARSNLSFDLGYMDQYQVSNSGNTNNNILYFNANLYLA
jgi:hypothetical protein